MGVYVCVRARGGWFSPRGEKMEVLPFQESPSTPAICSHPPICQKQGLQPQKHGGRSSSTGRGESGLTSVRVPTTSGPLPGERKQRRAPGACRERSPGLQSIRRRCAQDELCIQGRSPRATRRAQTGAFCPGMVGGGRGRLAVSGRLPLARQQLRLGSSLFQLVPPEVFSSRQLVAGRGSASFRTVNYAAFVCRVGGWGQG